VSARLRELLVDLALVVVLGGGALAAMWLATGCGDELGQAAQGAAVDCGDAPCATVIITVHPPADAGVDGGR
jgi:hypothetical protein